MCRLHLPITRGPQGAGIATPEAGGGLQEVTDMGKTIGIGLRWTLVGSLALLWLLLVIAVPHEADKATLPVLMIMQVLSPRGAGGRRRPPASGGTAAATPQATGAAPVTGPFTPAPAAWRAERTLTHPSAGPMPHPMRRTIRTTRRVMQCSAVLLALGIVAAVVALSPGALAAAVVWGICALF